MLVGGSVQSCFSVRPKQLKATSTVASRFLSCLGCAGDHLGRLPSPTPSPYQKVSQTLGYGTKVFIDCYASVKKQRKEQRRRKRTRTEALAIPARKSRWYVPKVEGRWWYHPPALIKSSGDRDVGVRGRHPRVPKTNWKWSSNMLSKDILYKNLESYPIYWGCLPFRVLQWFLCGRSATCVTQEAWVLHRGRAVFPTGWVNRIDDEGGGHHGHGFGPGFDPPNHTASN